MNRQSKIQALIAKLSDKKSFPIDPDESLFESGYLDSFGLADLVMEIEREFGITIPDADVTPRTFESVTRIDSYLEQHGA